MLAQLILPDGNFAKASRCWNLKETERGKSGKRQENFRDDDKNNREGISETTTRLELTGSNIL
jgi:hypothetical protein